MHIQNPIKLFRQEKILLFKMNQQTTYQKNRNKSNHFLSLKAAKQFLEYVTSISSRFYNSNIQMAEKSTVEQDKQRSELLRKQLTQMGEDFQFMKKSKQEWKKQLDARFQDIERKIENSKQYIANEAKRTNDTLLAFQHKFQFQIKKTREDLQYNIDTLSKETNQKFEKKNKQVADLNKDLSQQTKNRNGQFEEGQKQTREKFEKTNEAIQKEKQNRIQSEKQNMGKLNESLFLLKENLKQEKDQRNAKINQLEKNINYELASQRKFNDQFHNKTFNDFKQCLGSLREEMQARFNSKDEIVNALSKVVKTIQDTLRHPN